MDNTSIREFIKTQKNPYMLHKFGHQCLLANWIELHMSNENVLAILDWTGSRDTSCCNAYTDICERITGEYGFPDPNSSYATHETWGLVSDLIVTISERDKSVAIKARKDKIEKLKSEISELEEKNSTEKEK